MDLAIGGKAGRPSKKAIAAAKTLFLQAYGTRGTILGACEKTHADRRTVYRWLESDPEFAKNFEIAKDEAVERMENRVYDRGLEKSTLDSIFWLKGARPEKYREDRPVLAGSITINIQGLEATPRPVGIPVTTVSGVLAAPGVVEGEVREVEGGAA